MPTSPIKKVSRKFLPYLLLGAVTMCLAPKVLLHDAHASKREVAAPIPVAKTNSERLATTIVLKLATCRFVVHSVQEIFRASPDANYNDFSGTPAFVVLLKALLPLHPPETEPQKVGPPLLQVSSGSPSGVANTFSSSLVTITAAVLGLALLLLLFFIAWCLCNSKRRVERMTHLFKALSELNQSIVRLKNEDDLFPLVCRAAVIHGGMKSAFVGRIQGSGQQLEIVAGEGTEETDLTPHRIVDLPANGSLTKQAIADHQPIIINDVGRDRRTASWGDAGRRFGWGSSAVFPIFRQGKAFAILSVFHRQKRAFDTSAIELLEEMANDIGFALDNFDRETQRIKFQQALSDSENRMSTILENVGACIYLKDLQGRYTYANRRVLDLWQFTDSSQIIGSTDDKLFPSSSSLTALQTDDQQVLQQGQVIKREETFTIGNSEEASTFWTVKLPLRDSDGAVYALCGISTDISGLKKQEEHIRFLTNFDPLTGLPNRALFHEKVQQALVSAEEKNDSLALVDINLDRFKIVNDSLGHGAGDRVLKIIAERLRAELDQQILLSRLGADEYLLLLPGENAQEADRIARQLLRVITDPIDLGDDELSLTASMGIALYPDHGVNIDQLIQSANSALAEAKKRGRNTFRFFSEPLRTQARETLLLENELRRALEEDQFQLLYQPQVNMESGKIIGVEALVRWQHPELGTVPPSRFISLAEENGLIVGLGDWVMETAAKQLALWQHQECLSGLSVAVNLSVVQIYEEDFCRKVASVIDKFQLDPTLLELEITERIALVHSGRTLSTLQELHGMGVTLSIDDFGTGFSSLSYLKRYPVHKLKVDKSFVDGLGHNDEDQAIVQAVIGIARALHFETVAEGVETREQWQFLREHGCDTYQGYYFSKPVSADEIETLLCQTAKAETILQK